MKKNTKLGMAIGYVALVISGVFAVIGAVADIFGFAKGVTEYKESILGIFYSLLSIFAAWWKLALAIAAVMTVAIIFIRRAQKKEMEDRETRILSWFDAKSRNTKYSGGEEYLCKLKRFLKQDEAGLSWWAVTGVAGIGKTRLVIEALRDKELINADVQCLRSFDDYREDALKERVDSILEQPNLRNIIIAEDAQIYMDNIGVLIEYIAEKPVSELGKHKILILLLIRMGEDEDLRDRYKQLASKTRRSTLQKSRFSGSVKELRVERYNEEDIAEVVKSYVVITKKKRKEKALIDGQISEIQKATIDVLRSERMDPRHLRPLFAMFIADALLAGKDPMSWDLKDVLEYAVVEREEEFLQLEARDIQRNDNPRIFDKIRAMICLAIIRNGITLSEVDDIKKELEEELQFSRISLKDFLKEMQLLGDDGIIHLSMPDILSEYYVLRYLVIEPDEVIVKWIIGQLCGSLKGADAFRQKIRQDFRHLYSEIGKGLNDFYYAFFEQCNSNLALEIIKELLSQKDLHDSNNILLHEAVESQIRNRENESMLSALLSSMIHDMPDIDDKRSCLSELERLSKENVGNADILLDYAKGLVNMICDAPEMEEKRRCLTELKRLYEKNKDNADTIHAYCNGLVSMIIPAPEMEEKRNYLFEAKKLYEENAGNEKIELLYCEGLYSIIIDAPEMKENRNYLTELKRLYEKNTDNSDVVLAYCHGLLNMIKRAPTMKERKSYLSLLERLSQKNASNVKIVFDYCKGLCDMIKRAPEIKDRRSCLSKLGKLYEKNRGKADIVFAYNSGLFEMVHHAPEIKDKRSCLSKLKRLFEENVGNTDAVLSYCGGLGLMITDDPAMENKRSYVSELKRMYDENADNEKIELLYCGGLYNIIDAAPDVEDKRIYFSKMKRLSEENADNIDVAVEYCIGVYNMLEYDDEHYNDYIGELYRVLSDKRTASRIAMTNSHIIINTRRELLDYEYERGNIGINDILKGLM